MSGALTDFFGHLSSREQMTWPAGEYHWHVHVLPPAHVAETIAATYAPLAGLHPELAVVAAPWIHVTVLHSVPEHVLTRRQVTAVRDRLAARLADLPPIETVVRPACVWGAFGVAAPVTRTRGLEPLWAAARDVLAEVSGSGEHLPRVYAPHITTAYATGPVPVDDVRRWLGDRDLPTLTFTITELHLLLLRHDNRSITWRSATAIPLATR
jgi:2'-5' RNA ligase